MSEKDTARLRYTQTEKVIADPNTTSTVLGFIKGSETQCQ
ncbi:hypothetical protein ACUXOL_002371 [Staphylococcus epidermidis]